MSEDGRATLQEGTAGSGLDFLAMQRAMLDLLQNAFPGADKLMRGWTTPRHDPLDTEDPVPDRRSLDPAKAAAIVLIEDGGPHFAEDDSYGLFVETYLRPSAADPTARSPDTRLGLDDVAENAFL